MITVGEQIADMAVALPDWSCERQGHRTAVWQGTLAPHQTSYVVRIEYTEPLIPEGRSILYVQPLVEVLAPQLSYRFGIFNEALPHVYFRHPRTNRSGPFLCLFDDLADEWSPADWISDTTVPWASNWLSCYESWLATGKWFGTGRHIRTDRRTSKLKSYYNATTSSAALTRDYPSTP